MNGSLAATSFGVKLHLFLQQKLDLHFKKNIPDAKKFMFGLHDIKPTICSCGKRSPRAACLSNQHALCPKRKANVENDQTELII